MRYEFHPACAVLPRMDEGEFEALKASIRSGFDARHPVVLHEGMILDGRHRYLACEAEGVAAKFTEYTGTDPYDFVRREHEARRSWQSQVQKALVCEKLLEMSSEWQAKRQAIRDESLARMAAAKTGNQNAAKQGTEETTPPQSMGELFPSVTVSVWAPSDQPKNVTAPAKAAALGVNRGAVEQASFIRKHSPDLAVKVEQGEVKATDAIREIKRAEVVTKLEDVKVREVKALAGVYDVIVLDPPWPMQKIERDERPNQAAFDYPTMSESELRAMAIPCATDCHVWVWTTHKFMPMAFRLLEEWGLSYVCCFTWHKPGGFQPIGLPQYNCEFALYARKGTPKFIDTKAFPVCFDAGRGKHSEKPEEFYDVIRRVTAGRRLDMFNRREISGFDGWGNEAA